MGLLSNIFGSDTEGAGGLLSGLGNALSENSNLLLGYGAGGAEGMMRGGLLDDNQREKRKKLALDEKRKQNLALAAQKLGIDPMLAEAVPDLVGTVAAKKYTPKEYGLEESYLRGLQQKDPAKFNQFMETKYGGTSGALTSQFAQRKAIAEQSGLKPDHPAYQSFILTGKMPREDAQELTATDKKELWSSEDELPAINGTLESLNRAKELNYQTFTGKGAEAWGNLGTSDLPLTGFIDQPKAKATKEFGQLMSLQAIEQMVGTLKGATTDNELQQFKSVLADPATPPDIREKTIARMMTLAQRKKEIAIKRIESIGGPGYLKGQSGAATNAPAPSGAIQVDGYTIRQR